MRNAAMLPTGEGDIGRRVRAARREAGMTQVQLAAAIGITQGSLSAIERGNSKSPAAETLLRLSEATRCRPEWIMRGAGTMRQAEGAVEQSTEHELLTLWRSLPEARRQAVLDALLTLLRALAVR